MATKQKVINELIDHLNHMSALIETWHEEHDEAFYAVEEYIDSIREELDSISDE